MVDRRLKLCFKLSFDEQIKVKEELCKEENLELEK
jgi:hypothetical protein